MIAPDAGEVEKLAAFASLWVGSDLTWLEQLCIQSYLDLGHSFTLYTLGPIANVPDGAVVKNARDILAPPFDIAGNTRLRVAIYSDVFRLKMFTLSDAIWVDLDTYAVKTVGPVDGDRSYVFGVTEFDLVQNAVLRLPRGSAALQHCLDFVTAPNPIRPWRKKPFRRKALARIQNDETWGIEDLPWGCSGPKAVTHFLKQTREISHAAPPHVFHAVNGGNHHRLFQPDDGYFAMLDPTILHFFGGTKKRIHDQPDWHGLPPAESFLATLCARHGIDPRVAPVGNVPGFF